MSAASRTVRVRVPAKLNLALRVGPRQVDGYHRVATVFHAIDRCDYVTATPSPVLSVSGPPGVPTGPANLAWHAATALAAQAGVEPAVHLAIDKTIPVAGGMAGGSADAAATLVACDALWGLQTPAGELERLAAGLGSDVPFALRGGTALGLGRGDELTTVFGHGRFHWVAVPAAAGLSTPSVYAEFDRAGPAGPEPSAADLTDVVAAVQSGSARDLAAALCNDLQAPALRLRPELAGVLAAGRAAGALTGLVSGSGPTCLFLAASPDHAFELANAFSGAFVTSGPAAGAAIV